MGTQGPGRKRIPNRERLTAEDDALNQIAREAEARLAAKRAARAEAREIRMKELERQQKELFHSHKKYYGLDNKWGHIEQWMEDSERYSRHSRRHTSISDDEERMSVGSRGSLRPSDYSGFLGSSSRASSRASSARASPVVEERPDRDFLDKGSRTASTLSAATLASLGGASSRRGSCDTSFSVETEASIREIKDSLAEAEEKYRKAMVSNAQLHNEKTTLMYQVETLREELSDMEEVLWEARRHCDDTTKEFERERQAHSVLQFQFKEMKETLRQTEELLTKHGVVVSPEITTNGETGHGEADDDVSAESGSQLAQEASHGRESMLGKAAERRPAGGSRVPQDDRKLNLQTFYRRSQSLNEEKDQLSRREKHQGRNRTKPRNTTSVKDLRFTARQDDGVRKKVQTQPGPDPALKGRTKPDRGSEFRPETSAASLLAVPVVEKKRSFEGPLTPEEVVSPVCRTSTSRLLRSRLVPPRPAKDIILDNKAVVSSFFSAEKLNSQKQDARGNEFMATCSSTGRDGPGLRGEVVSERAQCSKEQKIDEVSSPTSEKSEINEAAPEETITGLSVNETVVLTDQISEQQQTLSETDDGGSEDLNDETQLKTSGLDGEEAVNGGTVQEPEEHEDLERGAERPDSKDQTVTVSGLEDWTGLEKTIQNILRGFVESLGLGSETSGSVNRWISDLEETLRKSVLNQQESTNQMKPELSLTDPGSRPGRPAVPNSSVSEVLQGEVQTHEVSVDSPGSRGEVQVQDLREEQTSEVVSGMNQSDVKVTSCQKDFVFIESYFSEPVKTRSVESASDQGLVETAVMSKTNDRDEDLKDVQLKRHRTLSTNSGADQSSKIRRLLEITADEIRAMAVPELVLKSLRDGRVIDESPPSNPDNVEERSIEDMDSCEEADEKDTMQQLATQPQCQPVTEVVIEDVKVVPASRKRWSLDDRKQKNTAECQIS
ncbi:leucine-rich repeat flightless-interacting protein 1 isoform X13 [Lates calcarifer]|uniref:Leucine-rich repeat flightless-interacting protein 1 isoform X13 n=1 Tax=Lates calcarifer TaxID=8187 RepID=A0AAJ7PJR1_LATCA|nr:leucine-rich repeat flightless-interacting protein 1 isoform X13 [Lates calcarifer]